MARPPPQFNTQVGGQLVTLGRVLVKLFCRLFESVQSVFWQPDEIKHRKRTLNHISTIRLLLKNKELNERTALQQISAIYGISEQKAVMATKDDVSCYVVKVEPSLVYCLGMIYAYENPPLAIENTSTLLGGPQANM